MGTKKEYTFYIRSQKHTCGKEDIEDVLGLLKALDSHGLNFHIRIMEPK